MRVRHFLKSAFVGIAVAVLVLVLGVAGEVAWLALGLPGVHRTACDPTTNVGAGTKYLGGIHATTTYDRSETISGSCVDMSFVPPIIVALAGLAAGFSWAYKRRPAQVGS